MARRRSRRRKSSYSEEIDSSDVSSKLVVEDLSPRAKRLAESGVVDLTLITGSGEGGRITSGDILHAARVMEVEQSVARIESVGHNIPAHESTSGVEPDRDAALIDHADDGDDEASQADVVDRDEPQEFVTADAAPEGDRQRDDEAENHWMGDAGEGDYEADSDSTTTSASNVATDSIEVPHTPWDAYNGSSEGLAESAMPGAEQSWGEAEANIAAIAEEAAAQIYGRQPVAAEPPPPVAEPGVGDHESSEPETSEFEVTDPVLEEITDAPAEEHVVEEPAAAQPTAVVAAISDIEAAVDPEPPVVEKIDQDMTDDIVEISAVATTAEQRPEPTEAMMDFGTLELVDPESVWAEGAEDFAPWFLAHSKQLGDVLGLEAGLSDARQFTTKSATGVVGRDDNGDEVVVVSSQNANSDDSDLGRALGMAASSGAATVALVSARFDEDQLKALSWLNNQTRSGVRWYGIEMRVVRIADSPAAMLFDLVAQPPS